MAAILLISEPVEAESAVDSTSADAIGLGQSGLAHFQNEQWQLALDDFRAADATMHSPVFGLYTARCLRNLGRWVDAFHQYQAIATAQRPVSTPAPWQRAYTTAESELADLGATIPRLRFRFEVGVNATTAVEIDGEPVPLESDPLMLDPGVHVLIIRHHGIPIETRQLVLQPAQGVLEVAVGPYASAKTATSVAASKVVPAQSHTRLTASPASNMRNQPESSVHDVAVIAVGAGFLGLAVGIATGAYAWHERRAISEQCDNDNCPTALSSRIDRGKLLADCSTAAFSVAALSFATAGVLLYVVPRVRRAQSSVLTSAGLEFGLTAGF